MAILTCSSDVTLSLPSYTGSALNRDLNFCNGYLSLLYFWCTTLSTAAMTTWFVHLKWFLLVRGSVGRKKPICHIFVLNIAYNENKNCHFLLLRDRGVAQFCYLILNRKDFKR